MILLVDSFDSFTYNLAALLRSVSPEGTLRVCRVDDEAAIASGLGEASLVVLSPGPGRPERGGVLARVVNQALGRVPLLGVCLGHQAIAVALGGELRCLERPVHGKVHEVLHDGRGEYAGIGMLRATRYHSIVADEATLPGELEISSRAATGEILSFRHREAACFGWQYHPESVASSSAALLVSNLLGIIIGETRE